MKSIRKLQHTVHWTCIKISRVGSWEIEGTYALISESGGIEIDISLSLLFSFETGPGKYRYYQLASLCDIFRFLESFSKNVPKGSSKLSLMGKKAT